MLKKILESTIIMGSSSVFVMAMDLIRVKFLAILLGPQGVGTLSVLNQFHIVALTVTNLGLGTGIVKYVATFESDDNQKSVKKLITSAFQIVLLIASTAFVLCLVLSRYLSLWILKDPKYFVFIIIYSISLPLAVYPMVASNFLRGLKRIKALAKINIFRSLCSLLFIIPIVYFYRLKGAIFAVLVITSVHFILTYYYLKKENRSFRIFKFQNYDPSMLKILFPYGVASLITGLTYYLSHLVLKMIIVRRLGIEMNGIYQPIWALTMTYPVLILTSMSAYSYPRICELKTNQEIVDELNGIVRITTLLTVPVMFLLMVAREPIIQILYSSDFLAATEYMRVQILGDFFRVLVWTIGMFFLPTKRIQAFIWLGVLPDTLLVLLTATLVVQYQLHGIVFGFALCYMLTFLIYYWYSKNAIGFKFWRRNLVLILSSFFSLAGVAFGDYFFDPNLNFIINLAIILSWSLLSIKVEEVNQLKAYVSDKLIKRTAASEK